MLIHEAATVTGLSKKAIRFYEAKGLISAARRENSYRTYSDDDVKTLQKIKLLRLAGVRVSDIKLLFSNVLSLNELIEKREKEMKKEYGQVSELIANFHHTISMYQNKQFQVEKELDENAVTLENCTGEFSLGIDIGTTTISATVLDLATQKQVDCYTVLNHFRKETTNPAFSEYDADGIVKKVFALANCLLSQYQTVKTIGITGQMHGILYVDKNANAPSPLFTWQDKRGDLLYQNNQTYCEALMAQTGMRLSTGFGFVTHFYNLKNGLVPKNAHSICTIMDYVAMKLAGTNFPVMHVSNAASLGCFNVQNCAFCEESLQKAGLNTLTLPRVTDEYLCLGTFRNVPVSVAIGDNQASFLGSVKDIEHSILVNIGTGSQISAVADGNGNTPKTEVRPLVKDRFIHCGSALCGGEAFALLERFLKAFYAHATQTEASQYEVMNRLAQIAYDKKMAPLSVTTAFRGERNNPNATGAITGITAENFTPEQLVLGFLHGICNELYQMFCPLPPNKTVVVASGNAVQKIPVLKHILEDMFQLPVVLSNAKEEAAAGAALFSAIAKNCITIKDCENFITYKEGDLSNEN